MAKKKEIKGNLLVKNMRERMSNTKNSIGSESEELQVYKTGFDAFDFLNGRVEDDREMLGIDSGKIVYVVGNSGTGKSTIVRQMACHIADQFELGTVMDWDAENANSRARVRGLTGWSKEKFMEKYMHINRDTYSESFYSFVMAVADNKRENKDLYMYDTGLTNDYGETVMEYQPTIVVLDSLSRMLPKSVQDEEEISGGMTQTANAKINAGIFRRLVPHLEETNIIIFLINHITDKVAISMADRTQAKVNYLGQNESIPGGTVPIFLANTFIKLKASTKLKPEEGYGIDGFLVDLMLIKSRSNSAGNEVKMVFDKTNGYSNALTNLEYIKAKKLLRGNGRAYYIDDMPDVKFRQKNFLEIYNSNAEFKEAFDKLVRKEMYSMLNLTVANNDGSEVVEITEDMLIHDKESNLYYHEASDNWYDKDEDTGEFLLVIFEEEE